MENGVTEIMEIETGGFQNFIYQDTQVDGDNETVNVKYKLTVQMFGGSASIGVRRCKSFD